MTQTPIDTVPVEDSILNSTKKILGLDADYDDFDLDVMTHINKVFFDLSQLGIGPAVGYFISGPEDLWEEFLQPGILQNAVRTYVYLRVRLLFDPPNTSFAISAMEKQIEELAYRLNTEREATAWVNPNLPVV